MRDRTTANELCYKCDCRRSDFAMIDDMALLKQAMEQMDTEDPVVAQAAKDRAAQTLSDAKLNFSKMAELIEQRRLLLQPRIVANIKRMDQPGMLGDAAFRNIGSTLRREGQSFRQIAEAIESTGRLAPPYEDSVQKSEPLRQTASEPSVPTWRRALAFVGKIVFSPLRRRILSLAITLIAILLLYALHGFVAIGEQVSGYFDGAAAVRTTADKAISLLSSFVDERISPQSKKATVPPTPPAPIPSPATAVPSPPSATPSVAPAVASAPPTTAPTPPAHPSAAPVGPPVSTSRRAAPRGDSPPKPAANCGAAQEDRVPCSRRSAPVENDRPRAFEDMIQEGIRRNSHMGGPCIRGVGGCYWGGGQY
jgi:hypothetical protein